MMFRKLWVFFIILLMSQVVYAEPVKITEISIMGGDGNSEAEWKSNGTKWSTSNNRYWIVGVSLKPFGQLINKEDGSIPYLPSETYYLYVEPENFGKSLKLVVTLSDGKSMSAIFEVSAKNGNGTVWKKIAGNELQLAWIKGKPEDKVSQGRLLTPSSVPDNCLELKLTGVNKIKSKK